MGHPLCVICNANSFHSFYTNLAYIQISSTTFDEHVCGWGSGGGGGGGGGGGVNYLT